MGHHSLTFAHGATVAGHRHRVLAVGLADELLALPPVVRARAICASVPGPMLAPTVGAALVISAAQAHGTALARHQTDPGTVG